MGEVLCNNKGVGTKQAAAAGLGRLVVQWMRLGGVPGLAFEAAVALAHRRVCNQGIDALPGQDFQGRISAIDPGIDPGTRNFLVQATFDNPEHRLRPGTFARIQAQIGEPEPVLVLPQTAISFNPYGNSVYLISQQPGSAAGDGPEPVLTVRQRFIRTGDTRGDLVVVTEGLAAGDRVATSGLLKLRNDAIVEINDRVQPSSDLDPTPDNS